MIYKDVSLKITTALLASTFLLVACGGETVSETHSVTEPVVRSIPAEPVQISANSWGNQAVQDEPVLHASVVEGDSYLTLRALGLGDLTNKYWQIHIDSDNNPATGFQFLNNAWSGLSGVDYIIENGNVYQSMTNDNHWNWKLVEEWPIYKAANAPEAGDLRFSLNAYDKGICGDINIGAIVLDHTWTIETFHPAANALLRQTTTFCDVNHPPVMTLNEGDITHKVVQII